MPQVEDATAVGVAVVKPGDFDPVAVSKALRCEGYDLEPGYYLDPPLCTKPGTYVVTAIGRMDYRPIGEKEVHWTGSQWTVSKRWLSRVDLPEKARETVFDGELSKLAK